MKMTPYNPTFNSMEENDVSILLNSINPPMFYQNNLKYYNMSEMTFKAI